MNPSDLERIVSLAEVACAAAVSQPKEALVRQRLYHALAPLVSPAFPGEDPEVAHLQELSSQARVWADIVRTRIAGFDANRLTDPSGFAIRFPARDLLSDPHRPAARTETRPRRLSGFGGQDRSRPRRR